MRSVQAQVIRCSGDHLLITCSPGQGGGGGAQTPVGGCSLLTTDHRRITTAREAKR